MNKPSLTSLLIPNFIEFLERNGEVKICNEIPAEILSSIPQNGLRPKPIRLIRKTQQYSTGQRNIVLLNDDFLGFLDAYQNPDALFYSGKVPGFKTASGVETLCLSYTTEENSLGKIGRADNWKDIPFP